MILKSENNDPDSITLFWAIFLGHEGKYETLECTEIWLRRELKLRKSEQPAEILFPL